MSQIPIGTKAAMVRRVLNEPYARHALPSIASHFGVTLQVLHAVLHNAGYPDTIRMERNAITLEEQASQAIADRAKAEQTGHDVDEAAVPAEEPAGDRRPQVPGFEAHTTPDLAPSETGRLTLVRVADLHVDPTNLRPPIDPESDDIRELAESIAQAGLLQPIVARRSADRLLVVMGHRRYAAIAHRLHWDTVECIVRGPMTQAEVLAAMLIENGQRKDLDPIAEMRGLVQLQHVLGCSDVALARRIGRSSPWVASRLDLRHLSAVDQTRVQRGELAIGAANSAVRSSLKIRQGQTGVDRNWHLGPRHRLAEAVRALCDAGGHVAGRKLGGIGCGECWESTIRSDERRRVLAELAADDVRSAQASSSPFEVAQ